MYMVAWSSCAEAKEAKNILLLSAYHPNFYNGFKQIKGIRSVLPAEEYNLDVEFMDSKRFEDEKTQKMFADNLKNRIDRLPKYDIIIAAEDNALEFAVSHKSWFKNIPIVFLGVNDIARGKKLAESPLITGVLESISMSDTINLIKKLQPNVKSVTAISDASSTGKVLAEEFKYYANDFTNLKMSVLSLNDLSWDYFIQEIPEYGKDNAFLLLSIYQDKNKKSINFNDGVKALLKNAKSPVYYLWDNGVGLGIVGGKVISHYEQGREAALIVKHYFDTGILAPIVKDSPNKVVLDYKAIKKFGINEKNIPNNALLENKESSFFVKHLRWFLLGIIILMTQTGLIIALLVNRFQRDKALNTAWKSEENLRITLESIGDGVIATDVHGNITKINKVAETLTGWKRTECLGQPLKKVFCIINATTGREIESPVSKVLETGDVVDLANHTVLISKDGKKRSISDSGAPIFNDVGNIVGVVLVFRDVTEKELYEKVTKENEERMKMFFSSTRDGIYCIDFDEAVPIKDRSKDEVINKIRDSGHMLFANKRVANLIGFNSEKEIIGHTLPEVAFSDEALKRQKLLLEALADNDFTSCNVETTATSIDGVQKNINYKVTGVVDDGYLLKVWAVMEDVTELKKAEEQFHQAQKMDVIGRLAGGVAHDFNNMLAGILGHAELLDMKTDEESPLKRHVRPIIEASTRAADLTNKLLAFSRKGKTVSATLDMHETITSAMGLLERSFDKKIAIDTKFHAENSKIVGDPTLLQNALLNLALNARDAMPTGGVLSFSTSNIFITNEAEASAYSLSKGEYLEINVSDSGCGMSKEVISKIFEPFFTTKPVGKGTGLGLSAVYGTIKEHKGAINVYSEAGSGTLFKIYLPVEASKSKDTTLVANENNLVSGEGLVFVIDDEEIIREMAKAILSSLGYKVLSAADADEAIRIFKKYKEEISLVILDMVMPKKSGKEIFEMLKEIKPDVNVLISSGFSKKDNIDEMIKDGARGFIQKPYRQASLSQAIAEVLVS